MNIGLVVYSHTGNTFRVAEKIKVKLEERGHTANLEQIQISGDKPAQPGKFELTGIPAIEAYDALILGAPVQAFSLNPVMKAYLAQLPRMEGKKVALFVTKQLPALWLGGTGSIKIMKQECESRGAKVIGSDIVVWAPSKRDQTTTACVNNMQSYFTGS
ncbi:MAG: flavodoxin [Firmicutes bacterium]|nr:flavodoxin [Bacillota bacterium]